MIKLFIASLMFLSLLKAEAIVAGLEKANKVCANAVTKNGDVIKIKRSTVYHDSDYLILGLAGTDHSSVTFISQTDATFREIDVKDYLIDFTTSEEAIYVLGKMKIFKFNKKDLLLAQESETLDQRTDFSRYSNATGISYYQNQLYISHGTLGLVVREAESLKQKSHTKLPLAGDRGHRAQVTDVDVKENQVLLGVDNITGSADGTRGAEGYYLLASDNLSDMVYRSIDVRREALDHPQVFLDENNNFFALNWFYLFKYKLSDFNQRRVLRPIGRFWQTEPKGNFIGRISMDSDYIYSCSKTPEAKGIFVALKRELYNF